VSSLIAPALLELIRAESPARIAIDASDWPLLIQRAVETDTLGLVAAQGAGLCTDPTLRSELEAHLRRESRHQAICFVEAERLSERLEAAGIEMVVLKGCSLARTVYPRSATRTFRDLDLLVRPEQAEPAYQLLRELGYVDAVDPTLLAAYRRHHFHLILEGPGRPRVELHWNLVRPDEPYRLGAEEMLVDRFVPVGPNAFWCPHPDGQILHVCASLLRSGFTELKRLVDIDRLVRSGSEIRWAQLTARAQRHGLAPTLRVALELTERLLGTPLDAALAIVLPVRAISQRLETIGVENFPLLEPPADWRPLRHAVRFWLLDQKTTVLRQFIFNPAFERARLRAIGTSLPRRVLTAAKRAVIAAWMAGWQLGWLSMPRHRS
jgi:hypothetical protein